MGLHRGLYTREAFSRDACMPAGAGALVSHNLRDGPQSIKYGNRVWQSSVAARFSRLHPRPGVSIVSHATFSYCPGLGSQRRPDPHYALQHAKHAAISKGQPSSGAPVQL